MTMTRIDRQALLEGLTDPQRQAVEHLEGPLLVLAAAGSGKTRVITRRIANLIANGVPPWSILALTFTNKAAREMRERVFTLLENDPRLTRGLTVTTFHALCARLLRRFAGQADLGVKPDYTIYPSGDQASLMKRVISDLNLSTSNFPPRSVLSTISNAKNELLDAAAYSMRAGDFYTKQVSKIYEAYERGLRAANAVDFDDLLMLTARMLRDDAEVRQQVQDRWQYLLIDEYQDTNQAQFSIASLIAGEGREIPGMPGEAEGPNICVVGDPDQAIYGWRGADVTNILDFEEHYPAAQVIRLGENFRSVAPILAVADTLIRNNKRRKHKDLFTSAEGGEDVLVEICLDEHHEAERAADWLQRLHDDDEEPMAWRDMAVFYRTNALSRVMEDTLRTRGIPYVIARGTAFYEREEVRNTIAYLRVIANPADEVSLERVVNTPSRGIGKQSLTQLGHWAQMEGIGLFEAMRRCRELGSLTSRAHNSMERFVALIDSLSGSGTFMGADLSGSLADLVERVIKESGLETMYAKQAQASKSETDEQRLDNLAEVVSSAAEFERQYEPEADPAAFPGADVMESGGRVEVPPLLAMLRGYLESVSLVADADKVDPAQGAVTLMTLHASKGLEFGGVAMLGLEEGLLPHGRAQTDENELEEERRLCFVGITRAMRHLRISCASSRAVRGFAERTISSRFLEELGTEHVRFRDLSDFDEGVRAFRSTSTAAPQGVGTIEELKPPMPPRASMGAASMVKQFPPGTMVRHPQFGIGRVLEVSGGSLARAKVEFRDAGVKTLILEYARLHKLDG